MIKNTLLTGIFIISLLRCVIAAEVYNESDGVVIFEIESTNSPYGLWKQKTTLAGFSGSGYMEFTGNDYSLGAAVSPLFYHFKINKGGTYLFDLHCAKMAVKGHTDWANDCYIRVVGDYTAAPGPHDVPKGNASLSLLKSDTKYFGGKSDAWEWASGDYHFTGGRLDPGGKKNKRTALYKFKSGEIYTLVISGRSKSFRINRAMFRHTSASKRAAQTLSSEESSKTDGIPPIPDDLDKKINAASFDRESHASNDTIIKSNKSHISNTKDESWICFQSFDFGTGLGRSIEVQSASASPEGGTIEVRTGSATGTLLGTIDIHKTQTWNDYELSSANLAGASGKKDLFLVFRGGNRNLFNLRDFIIRSGVSVDERLPTTPVRPPAGRVAYLADGNSPDPDDLGGSAAALAMLRAANLADRLAYFAHSCDLVRASNISAKDELNRQKLLQATCEDTATRWGGFEHITFWNCRTQQSEAIYRLVDQINASSEQDPLWILEAGEPDIIGYALKKANPAKVPFVKLLTHHLANDDSGDYFKWRQILEFGTEVVRIPDQNGYDAHLGRGLQRPLWAFHWARDHEDSRIRELWRHGKIAEEDSVVGFQDGKFDISDAGMMFYWITGGNSATPGYRQATVHDVRKLLEDYVAKVK
ncbi:MAG: carbohydrate-binding protein [Lacipirellulaceae bacterium]